MAIEIARFDPPVPVDLDGDVYAPVIDRLNSGTGFTTEVLLNGESDITPPADTHYKHNLVVFPQGNGVYRLLAPDSQVGTYFSDGSGKTSTRQGGRQIRLPEDTSIQAIASGLPGQKGKQAIYTVIFHHPGPSPTP